MEPAGFKWARWVVPLAWLGLLALIGSPTVLLFLLPALLLAAPLIHGRYLGLGTVVRLRRSPAPERVRATIVAAPLPVDVGLLPTSRYVAPLRGRAPPLFG